MPSDTTPNLASEARAILEYWELVASPVFNGRAKIPQGDGRQVLLVPGLFGNDWYLQTLSMWLRRIGYRPVASGLRFNAGCPDRLTREAEAGIRDAIDGDRPVAVIGHSRGGMLGKVFLTRIGFPCDRLILLGSPLGAILRGGRDALTYALLNDDEEQGEQIASPHVANAGRQAMRLLDPDCTLPVCDCGYIHDLLAPLPDGIAVTSIYSREDPVVAPTASRVEGANNIEIRGSHGGLVNNAAAYPHIAAALAN